HARIFPAIIHRHVLILFTSRVSFWPVRTALGDTSLFDQ
ncbi:unnamed protein product, partial [Arabidopsis halleri]